MELKLKNAKDWYVNGRKLTTDEKVVYVNDTINNKDNAQNTPSICIMFHVFQFYPDNGATFRISNTDITNTQLDYEFVEVIFGTVKVRKVNALANFMKCPKNVGALRMLIRVKTAGSTTGSKGTIFTVTRLQLSNSMHTVIDTIDDEVEVSYFRIFQGDEFQWTVTETETISAADQPLSFQEVSAIGSVVPNVNRTERDHLLNIMGFRGNDVDDCGDPFNPETTPPPASPPDASPKAE